MSAQRTMPRFNMRAPTGGDNWKWRREIVLEQIDPIFFSRLRDDSVV